MLPMTLPAHSTWHERAPAQELQSEPGSRAFLQSGLLATDPPNVSSAVIDLTLRIRTNKGAVHSTSRAKSARTYTVSRYSASGTYVYVTAGYVSENQLHGYVAHLKIYVRLLIARRGVAGQGMYYRIGMPPMRCLLPRVPPRDYIP